MGAAAEVWLVKPQGEPCDPEIVAVMAAAVQSHEVFVARMRDRGIEPPFPRTNTCTYCGVRTSMPTVSFEHGGRHWTFPSHCSAAECGDAAVEDQLRGGS